MKTTKKTTTYVYKYKKITNTNRHSTSTYTPNSPEQKNENPQQVRTYLHHKNDLQQKNQNLRTYKRKINNPHTEHEPIHRKAKIIFQIR